MALTPEEILLEIQLQGTDTTASQAMVGVGSTAEAQAERIQGAFDSISFAGLDLKFDGIVSRATQTATAVEAQGKRISGAFGFIDTAKSGMSFDTLVTQAGRAATEIEAAAVRAGAGWADVGKGGIPLTRNLGTLSSSASKTADAVETAFGRIKETSFQTSQAFDDDLISMGASMSATADEIEFEAARIEAALRRVKLAREQRLTPIPLTDLRQVDTVDRMHGPGGAGSSTGARAPVEGLPTYQARNIRENVRQATRPAVYAGVGAAVIGGYSLYDYARFYQTGQATAAAAGNMPPAVQAAMEAQTLKLYGSGPVGYKQIFGGYQAAGETFPQGGMGNKGYEKELAAIVEQAWKSAIGTHGSMDVIATALATAMHNWDLGPSAAGPTMDVLHSIAARGGHRLTVEQLSTNMGRSSAAAANLGISIPDWGSLYDTLAKQYSPGTTDTYLAGMFQHVQSQTPTAEKDLKSLGLANEFSAGGVQKYGIFKVLDDLQSRLQMLRDMGPAGAQQANLDLQQILPSQRGGRAFQSLMHGTHWQDVLQGAQALGGQYGPGGPATGVGGPDVTGKTEEYFKAMIKQPMSQYEILAHELGKLAITLGHDLTPAALSAAKGLDKMVGPLDAFAQKHPGAVTTGTEVGLGLGGAALITQILTTLGLGGYRVGRGGLAVGRAAGLITPAAEGVGLTAGGAALAVPAAAFAASDLLYHLSPQVRQGVSTASGNPLIGNLISSIPGLGSLANADISALTLANRPGQVGNQLAQSGNDIGGFMNRTGLGNVAGGLMGSIGGAFSNMGSVFAGLGPGFSQAMGQLGNGLDQFVTKFKQQMGEVGSEVKSAAEQWGGAIKTGIENALSGAGNIKDQIGNWLFGPGGGTESGSMKMWDGFTSGLKTALGSIGSDIKKQVQTWGSDITTGIGNIGSNIKKTAQSWVSDITTPAGNIGAEIKKQVGQWVSDVTTGIGNIGSGIKSKAGQWVSDITTPLGNAGGAIKQHVQTWTSDFVSGLGAIGNDIKSKAEKWAGDIGTPLANMGAEIKKQAGQWANDVLTGLGNLKDRVLGTVGSIKTDAVAAFQGLWTELKTTVGSIVSDIVGGFKNLWDQLTGHSVIPDMVKDIVTWFKGLPGKILEALKDLFTSLPQKFETLGTDMMTSIARGVTSNAGKLKNAVVNAAQAAATAAGNILGQIGNAIHGPNTPASGGYASGSQYGGFGGSSANYASSGDVAMLNSLGIRTSGTIMDTDFPTGRGNATAFRLPPGGAYTLLREDTDPNVGGYEVWKNNKTGGTIMFLHASQLSGDTPGTSVAGGTYVGKSGHPLTSAYGNDPSFWHLCVVTDSGERVWLSDSQMQQYVRGKSRGGGGPLNLDARYSPSQQANARTADGLVSTVAPGHPIAGIVNGRPVYLPVGPMPIPTIGSSMFAPGPATPGLPFGASTYPALGKLAALGAHPQTYTTFTAAEAGAQAFGSEVPGFLSQIQQLPKSLGDPLKNTLESMSGDWEKYLNTYNTTIENENKTHAANLQRLKDNYQHNVEQILARYDVKTQAGAARDAATIASDLSKQHPGYTTTTPAKPGHYVAGHAAYYSYDPTHQQTVTTHQKTPAGWEYDPATGKMVYHPASTTTSTHEETVAGHRVYHPPTQGHTTKGTAAHTVYHKGKDETAAINYLEEKYGISQGEAQQLLGISLNNAGYNAKGAVGRENTRHTKAVETAQTKFEANINSLQGKLNSFVKDLHSAFDPTKIISALHQAYQQAAQSSQDTLALHLYKGDLTDRTTTTPLTAAQRRANAQAEANGGSAIYSATTSTVTVQQQLDKLVASAVKHQEAEEKLTMAENQAQTMVDKAVGKIDAFGQDIQKTSDFLKEKFFQTLLNGGGIQEKYIQGMAQAADAQQLLTDAQTGLQARIAALRGDLQGMGQAVSTLATSYLQQWSEALVQGKGVFNSFLPSIQAAAKATADLAHAQNLQDVVIGRVTGDAQKLSTGLSGLFNEGLNKLTFWVDSIGRSGDGLNNANQDVTQLGDAALKTADNMGSLNDVLQSVQQVSGQLLSGIETEQMRGGAVSPQSLGEYAKAKQQETTLTWDKVAADLQAAKSSHDLVAYQQALGEEVQLLTSSLGYMKASGQENTQAYKDEYAQLQRVSDEYQGLTYVTQSLSDSNADAGKKANLNADQLQLMNQAMVDFQSPLDSGTIALQGHVGAINADNTAQQQLTTATQTATTEVTDLGTAALNAVTGVNQFVSALNVAVAQILSIAAGPGAGNASLAAGSNMGSMAGKLPGGGVAGAISKILGGAGGSTTIGTPPSQMPGYGAGGQSITITLPGYTTPGTPPSQMPGYGAGGQSVTITGAGGGTGGGMPPSPYDGTETVKPDGTHWVWNSKEGGWVQEVQIPDPSGNLHWVDPNGAEYKAWQASQGQTPAPSTEPSGTAAGGDSSPPSVSGGVTGGSGGGVVSPGEFTGATTGAGELAAPGGTAATAAETAATVTSVLNILGASALVETASELLQYGAGAGTSSFIAGLVANLPAGSPFANLLTAAGMGRENPQQLLAAADYLLRGAASSGGSGSAAALISGLSGGAVAPFGGTMVGSNSWIGNNIGMTAPFAALAAMNLVPLDWSMNNPAPGYGGVNGLQPPRPTDYSNLNGSGAWMNGQGTMVTTGYEVPGWSGAPFVGNTITTPQGPGQVLPGGQVLLQNGSTIPIPVNNYIEYPRQRQNPGLRDNPAYNPVLSRDYSYDHVLRQGGMDAIKATLASQWSVGMNPTITGIQMYSDLAQWGTGTAVSPANRIMMGKGYAFPKGAFGGYVYVGFNGDGSSRGWFGGPGGTVTEAQYRSGQLPSGASDPQNGWSAPYQDTSGNWLQSKTVTTYSAHPGSVTGNIGGWGGMSSLGSMMHTTQMDAHTSTLYRVLGQGLTAIASSTAATADGVNTLVQQGQANSQISAATAQQLLSILTDLDNYQQNRANSGIGSPIDDLSFMNTLKSTIAGAALLLGVSGTG